MVTQYRKKLDEYERGHPQSRKNLLKTIRLMGDSEARLQFPVLHPDHIKNASNVLHMVAYALPMPNAQTCKKSLKSGALFIWQIMSWQIMPKTICCMYAV